jgi:hypothetical protein
LAPSTIDTNDGFRFDPTAVVPILCNFFVNDVIWTTANNASHLLLCWIHWRLTQGAGISSYWGQVDLLQANPIGLPRRFFPSGSTLQRRRGRWQRLHLARQRAKGSLDNCFCSLLRIISSSPTTPTTWSGCQERTWRRTIASSHPCCRRMKWGKVLHHVLGTISVERCSSPLLDS